MDEPVRLVCPGCESVYRIRNFLLGKDYKCKKCGTGLKTLEAVRLTCPSCGAVTEEARLDPSAVPHCQACADAPVLIAPFASAPASDDIASSIASANRAAASSTRTVTPPRRESETRRREEGSLSQLPHLVEELNARLVAMAEAPAPAAAPAGADAAVVQRLNAVQESLADLGGTVRELTDRIGGASLTRLEERVTETGALFLSRLDEYREAQKVELAGLLSAPPAPAAGGRQMVEVDIDGLAERLLAGIKAKAPRLGAEDAAAVGTLAKVADELAREQSANTARLDQLAGEIREAVAGLGNLDEWRRDLPIRVSDEIGRTVEDRVVGPIASALSRQAPAILSDLQDNKLVDIVSRSVREAQRPLLREILAGGRGGVPFWLFAAILLPLLLILGYLLLPGDNPVEERTAVIADSLAHIEAQGLPLSADADERLQNIEAGLNEISAKALEHANNSGALAEQVRSLQEEVKAKDASIQEYIKTLEYHVRRGRAYENRLSQLGVLPQSIPD